MSVAKRLIEEKWNGPQVECFECGDTVPADSTPNETYCWPCTDRLGLEETP